MKPLAIDLFTGLHGWAEGLAAEGWDVIGFDIKDMCAEFGRPRPAGVRLVLQDVLTIHGSQFKSAHLIVCSPPCQKYSWLAMPWSRSKSEHSKAAKELRNRWETEGPDNRLFDACFRIQREAIEATGIECPACCGEGRRGTPGVCARCGGTAWLTRYIPLIVENVRGANEWVSPKSRYNYGSFHLWGDVPAIMPIQAKRGAGGKQNPDGTNHPKGSWFAIADSSQGDRRAPEGQKTQGGSWFRERNGVPQLGIRHEDRGGELKSRTGGGWFGDATGNESRKNDPRDVRKMPDGSWETPDGTKIGGDWFRDPACHSKHGSRSKARKAASAQIAKIPLPLSEHIARVFKPAPHPQK